ncbi:hypothetical protein CCYA_CCYA09G2645 [Cyanidiococcus yangmingshanensis]|nr:hypothetical protein CCYA_CCYA09G2645 [Cyanidiococcus yangmingshanensis]
MTSTRTNEATATAIPDWTPIWRRVFYVGTEWDQIGDVYRFPWDFGHLDADVISFLREPSVVRWYLFGATEPQLVHWEQRETVLPIPTVVVVQSKSSPPPLVGIKSVQRTEEEIVPMRAVKMGFFPLDISEWHSLSSTRSGSITIGKQCMTDRVQLLQCEQRRSSLRSLSAERLHRFDYVLPYSLRAELLAADDDQEVDSTVDGMAEIPERPGQPIYFEFDWEMDPLEEYISEQLSAESVADTDTNRAALRRAIQEAIELRQAALRKERAMRTARFEALTPMERESYRDMRIVKYYPRNDEPDIRACKTRFVNRYYGKANEVR